jgi:hypothetical protein
MRSIAAKALRIKAARVTAPVESILNLQKNPVLKNLLAQKLWTAFDLYDIYRPRQNL